MKTPQIPDDQGLTLRQNLIACVALFVALTGASAYAANTVFSADIVQRGGEDAPTWPRRLSPTTSSARTR